MFLSVFEYPRKTYRLITIKYIKTHFSTAMQEILWLTMIGQLKKYWISVMVKFILLIRHCIWLHHLSKSVSLSAEGMTSSSKKEDTIVIDRIDWSRDHISLKTSSYVKIKRALQYY